MDEFLREMGGMFERSERIVLRFTQFTKNYENKGKWGCDVEPEAEDLWGPYRVSSLLSFLERNEQHSQ